MDKVLKEEIIDTNLESAKEISKLKHTPGGAFGSCRYKLKDPKENKSELSGTASKGTWASSGILLSL